jgi:hypothetical protein
LSRETTERERAREQNFELLSTEREWRDNPTVVGERRERVIIARERERERDGRDNGNK